MRWAAEASLELPEGGVAGAAESIDRLVVFAHYNHVVGLVGAPTDQLQEQYLGHVGVLELVHEHVPKLTLVSEQDVRTVAEQLNRPQLLLAEIEQPSLVESPLIQLVNLGLLDKTQYFERGGVAPIGFPQ